MATRNNKSANGADALIGQRIAQLRQARGMTRKALAEVLNITHQQLHKYEKGTNRIAATRLAEIADKLEVSVMFFYEPVVGHAQDAQSFKEQRQCVEVMKGFCSINRPEQRDAIRKLVMSMTASHNAV